MNFPLTSRKAAERTTEMLKEQFGVSLARIEDEKKAFAADFGRSLQEFKASFSNYIASKTNYTQFQFQDYTIAKVVQEMYLKDPVVSAAIGRYQMHYPEPFRLIYDGDKESRDKDLINLTRSPNPWMSESKLDRYEITYQLWTGNSYTLIIRDDSGKPFQKFPFSGLNMYPVPGEDLWIDHFNFVTAEGLISRIEPEDVIFKSWISPDPRRNFMGISPMQLCQRDIQTNIGLTEFMASYINNLDVPGLIMTRTGKDAEFAIGMAQAEEHPNMSAAKELIGTSQAEAEGVKAQSKIRFGGENRGSTGVVEVGWAAEYLGFPLKDIVVEGAYCVPQTNICTNFYISPEYLKVEAGLRSSTYDNQSTSKLDFFQGILSTLWVQNADEESKALKPYFGENIKVEYDMSGVAVLKDFRNQNLGKIMPALTDLQLKVESGVLQRDAAMANAELMLNGVSDIDVERLFPLPKPKKQDLSGLTVSPSLNGVTA